MSGTLYLVATPIGNLGDITYRAVETLKNADVIACEDTRHTLKLLNYLEINKPLISYYKQKENEGSEVLWELLEQGKNVALVSDAGMPCVSDPGAVVSRKVRERGGKVTVVPGACALVSAIALCGIDSGFTFVGFLPEKNKESEKVLEEYQNASLPIVLYAAPHDVAKLLDRLYKKYGEREFFAVKEITKIYETVLKGRLGSTIIEEARGEFVLIVMPKEREEREIGEEEILSCLREKIEQGVDKKSAVKETAEEWKVSKNLVYKLALRL